MSKGDAATLERSAHTLKSSAGVFAAQDAAEAAAKVETLARVGDLAEAGAAFTALQERLRTLRAALVELTSSRTDVQGD